MLKRYDLPSLKSEGWAIIVIDTEIGFFSTVSDWGNYAFLWSNPGCEFRKFLTQLNTDYLLGKLMMGRRDRNEYSEAATKKAISQYLSELKKMAAENSDKYTQMYERESELFYSSDFYSYYDFGKWVEATTIEDAYEFQGTVPNHECMGFCTNIMPQFQQILKEELAKENAEV